MLAYLFWSFLIIYWLLFFTRLFLASYHQRQQQQIDERLQFNENHYTLVQTVTNGNPNVSLHLRTLLRQSTALNIIWLVDESDIETQQLMLEIIQGTSYEKRVLVYLIEDAPKNVNPKLFKLSRIADIIETPYFIVLDDNVMIDYRQLSQLAQYEIMKEDTVVSTIPMLNARGTFWSELTNSYVNSFGFLNSMALSALKANHTITGAMYVVPTELSKQFKLFEMNQKAFSEEVSIGEYLSHRGVNLVQSNIVSQKVPHIIDEHDYLNTMKRWFSYLREQFGKQISVNILVLVILPLIMSPFLLLSSLAAGWQAMLIALGSYVLKSTILYFYRISLVSWHMSISSIGYDILNEFGLLFVYIYALVTRNRFYWRGKTFTYQSGVLSYKSPSK